MKKCLAVFLAILIGFGPELAQAQQFALSSLPLPGSQVVLSQAFEPVLVKGLVVFPKEPLKFRFIVDSGNDKTADARIKEESTRMVKYFLAAVTVPENDQWVNLSPLEHDRMIADTLGATDLGRDMLAQDYVLKQFTASMLDPNSGAGKEFWARVYAEAQAKFGTTEIPVDAFNKVWIMPDKAEVFEHGDAVYVTKAHLKVMLDADYLAQQNVAVGAELVSARQRADIKSAPTGEMTKAIMRSVVLPAIEKEVNTGTNFSTVRQIYYAGILARWYRDAIKNTLMASAYMDKGKIKGVDLDDKMLKEQIYQRYIEAYKKGVVNFIREENNVATGEVIPRKYFSGGMPKVMPDAAEISKTLNSAAVTGAATGATKLVDFAASTNSDAAMKVEDLGKGVRFAVDAGVIRHAVNDQVVDISYPIEYGSYQAVQSAGDMGWLVRFEHGVVLVGPKLVTRVAVDYVSYQKMLLLGGVGLLVCFENGTVFINKDGEESNFSGYGAHDATEVLIGVGWFVYFKNGSVFINKDGEARNFSGYGAQHAIKVLTGVGWLVCLKGGLVFVGRDGTTQMEGTAGNGNFQDIQALAGVGWLVSFGYGVVFVGVDGTMRWIVKDKEVEALSSLPGTGWLVRLKNGVVFVGKDGTFTGGAVDYKKFGEFLRATALEGTGWFLDFQWGLVFVGQDGTIKQEVVDINGFGQYRNTQALKDIGWRVRFANGDVVVTTQGVVYTANKIADIAVLYPSAKAFDAAMIVEITGDTNISVEPLDVSKGKARIRADGLYSDLVLSENRSWIKLFGPSGSLTSDGQQWVYGSMLARLYEHRLKIAIFPNAQNVAWVEAEDIRAMLSKQDKTTFDILFSTDKKELTVGKINFITTSGSKMTLFSFDGNSVVIDLKKLQEYLRKENLSIGVLLGRKLSGEPALKQYLNEVITNSRVVTATRWEKNTFVVEFGDAMLRLDKIKDGVKASFYVGREVLSINLKNGYFPHPAEGLDRQKLKKILDSLSVKANKKGSPGSKEFDAGMSVLKDPTAIEAAMEFLRREDPQWGLLGSIDLGSNIADMTAEELARRLEKTADKDMPTVKKIVAEMLPADPSAADRFETEHVVNGMLRSPSPLARAYGLLAAWPYSDRFPQAEKVLISLLALWKPGAPDADRKAALIASEAALENFSGSAHALNGEPFIPIVQEAEQDRLLKLRAAVTMARWAHFSFFGGQAVVNDLRQTLQAVRTSSGELLSGRLAVLVEGDRYNFLGMDRSWKAWAKSVFARELLTMKNVKKTGSTDEVSAATLHIAGAVLGQKEGWFSQRFHDYRGAANATVQRIMAQQGRGDPELMSIATGIRLSQLDAAMIVEIKGETEIDMEPLDVSKGKARIRANGAHVSLILADTSWITVLNSASLGQQWVYGSMIPMLYDHEFKIAFLKDAKRVAWVDIRDIKAVLSEKEQKTLDALFSTNQRKQHIGKVEFITTLGSQMTLFASNGKLVEIDLKKLQDYLRKAHPPVLGGLSGKAALKQSLNEILDLRVQRAVRKITKSGWEENTFVVEFGDAMLRLNQIKGGVKAVFYVGREALSINLKDGYFPHPADELDRRKLNKLLVLLRAKAYGSTVRDAAQGMEAPDVLAIEQLELWALRNYPLPIPDPVVFLTKAYEQGFIGREEDYRSLVEFARQEYFRKEADAQSFLQKALERGLIHFRTNAEREEAAESHPDLTGAPTAESLELLALSEYPFPVKSIQAFLQKALEQGLIYFRSNAERQEAAIKAPAWGGVITVEELARFAFEENAMPFSDSEAFLAQAYENGLMRQDVYEKFVAVVRQRPDEFKNASVQAFLQKAVELGLIFFKTNADREAAAKENDGFKDALTVEMLGQFALERYDLPVASIQEFFRKALLRFQGTVGDAAMNALTVRPLKWDENTIGSRVESREPMSERLNAYQGTWRSADGSVFNDPEREKPTRAKPAFRVYADGVYNETRVGIQFWNGESLGRLSQFIVNRYFTEIIPLVRARLDTPEGYGVIRPTLASGDTRLREAIMELFGATRILTAFNFKSFGDGLQGAAKLDKELSGIANREAVLKDMERQLSANVVAAPDTKQVRSDLQAVLLEADIPSELAALYQRVFDLVGAIPDAAQETASDSERSAIAEGIHQLQLGPGGIFTSHWIHGTTSLKDLSDWTGLAEKDIYVAEHAGNPGYGIVPELMRVNFVLPAQVRSIFRSTLAFRVFGDERYAYRFRVSQERKKYVVPEDELLSSQDNSIGVMTDLEGRRKLDQWLRDNKANNMSYIASGGEVTATGDFLLWFDGRLDAAQVAKPEEIRQWLSDDMYPRLFGRAVRVLEAQGSKGPGVRVFWGRTQRESILVRYRDIFEAGAGHELRSGAFLAFDARLRAKYKKVTAVTPREIASQLFMDWYRPVGKAANKADVQAYFDEVAKRLKSDSVAFEMASRDSVRKYVAGSIGLAEAVADFVAIQRLTWANKPSAEYLVAHRVAFLMKKPGSQGKLFNQISRWNLFTEFQAKHDKVQVVDAAQDSAAAVLPNAFVSRKKSRANEVVFGTATLGHMDRKFVWTRRSGHLRKTPWNLHLLDGVYIAVEYWGGDKRDFRLGLPKVADIGLNLPPNGATKENRRALQYVLEHLVKDSQIIDLLLKTEAPDINKSVTHERPEVAKLLLERANFYREQVRSGILLHLKPTEVARILKAMRVSGATFAEGYAAIVERYLHGETLLPEATLQTSAVTVPGAENLWNNWSAFLIAAKIAARYEFRGGQDSGLLAVMDYLRGKISQEGAAAFLVRDLPGKSGGSLSKAKKILDEAARLREKEARSALRLAPAGSKEEAWAKALLAEIKGVPQGATDSAQDAVADNAAVGGIDIQNINVAKTGDGNAIGFDAAALQAMVDKGFDGLTPVFLGITPLENPLMALGVK